MCGNLQLFIYSVVLSIVATTATLKATTAVKLYRKQNGVKISQAIAALVPASMEWVTAILFVGAIVMMWNQILPVLALITCAAAPSKYLLIGIPIAIALISVRLWRRLTQTTDSAGIFRNKRFRFASRILSPSGKYTRD